MGLVRMAVWWMVLMFGVSFSLAESKSSVSLPTNVFANDPGRNLGMIWWRPKVVFDEKTASGLKKKIDALTDEQIKSGNLQSLVERGHLSAFVFPLLATQGEKGATVLGQILKQYAPKKELDDQWLLIIASLGRDPNPVSQAVLEAEFDRFLKEYNFSKPLKVNGKEYSNQGPNPIFALYDALLACYAGEGILTADKLEGLTKGNKYNEMWFVWRMGLEWAWQKMPESKILDIAAEGLGRCNDQDLIDVISFKGTKDLRLSSIEQFLASPERTRWRVIPAMLLRSTEYRKSIRNFLLVKYVRTLIMQAEASGGSYTLDEKVATILLTENLSNYPMLCYFCRILLSCHPMNGSEAWQAFLKKYAEKMDPKDEMYIEGGLMRIKDPKAAKIEGLYKPRPKRENKIPGVYINGFDVAKREMMRK